MSIDAKNLIYKIMSIIGFLLSLVTVTTVVLILIRIVFPKTPIGSANIACYCGLLGIILPGFAHMSGYKTGIGKFSMIASGISLILIFLIPLFHLFATM